MFTAWPEVTEDPELDAAGDQLTAVIADRYFEHLLRWLEAKPGEPRGVAAGRAVRRHMLYVTADELTELAGRSGPGRPVPDRLERPGAAAARRAAGHLPAPGLPRRHLRRRRAGGPPTAGPLTPGASTDRAVSAAAGRVTERQRPGGAAQRLARRVPPLLRDRPVPAVLERPDDLDVRRPDQRDRDAAGRGARAARRRGRHGLPEPRWSGCRACCSRCTPARGSTGAGTAGSP